LMKLTPGPVPARLHPEEPVDVDEVKKEIIFLVFLLLIGPSSKWGGSTMKMISQLFLC
jgi:hypothetical protein